MNRTIVLLLAAVSALGAAAVEVKTEQLTDNLWRVRVKRGEKWPESGMNRYGVYKAYEATEVKAAPVEYKYELTEKGFVLKFALKEGERVFGMGDVGRDTIQRRPGKYKMRVENITSYIPMPMFWTSEGWGVLLNSSWVHEIDIGKDDPNAVTFTAKKGEVDFYFFKGKDAKEILNVYTELTGRPKLLPIWGYGFTYVAFTQINQFELMRQVMDFRDRELPCDVIGLEPEWMSQHYDSTTRKSWDTKKFYLPYWAPAGGHTFIGAMNRVGMKLSLWLCCNYDLYKYEEELLTGAAKPFRPVKERKLGMGREAGEGIYHDEHVEQNKADIKTAYAGDPGPWHFKEGERPWFEHLRQFVDEGVSAFKLDCAYQGCDWSGEPNRKWANGMDDDEAHNLYPLIYAKQMGTGFEQYTGRRSMVYSACGWAGMQQYVASWSGDTGGGEKPLVSMLNLGLCGMPHQTVDMSMSSPEGIHFGFLAPWAQLNSWDYWYVPWIDTKARFTRFKEYAKLRYRLIPYIYSTAAYASRTGYPICRALSLVYPDHPEYDKELTTYMLGDSLLVSAFAKEVAIPEGVWYEWRTGEKVVGPCKKPVEVTEDWGGALYVKAGAVIPMWPQPYYLQKGWNDKVELHVWPGADGEIELYEDDGISVNYKGGDFALTKIEYKDGKVTIGERKGNFSAPKVEFEIVEHK